MLFNRIVNKVVSEGISMNISVKKKMKEKFRNNLGLHVFTLILRKVFTFCEKLVVILKSDLIAD